jgi:hypothetical protein
MAALALCGGVLVVPLLLIQSGPGVAGSSAPTGHEASFVASSGGAAIPTWRLASDTSAAPATGTTTTVAPTTTTPASTTTSPTTPPPTTAPAEEVAARVAPSTTTTVAPTTTTTTAPPVAAPAPSGVHYGQVTYYAHPAGECASPYLPFGTVVRITNPANGASTSCVVNDREADTARSIDLATATFATIAPLSQGVINAELSW